MEMDHDYVKTKKKRISRYCCVPRCESQEQPGMSFHFFPNDLNMKRKWEIALKITEPVTKIMKVCSRHFVKSDFLPSSTERRTLFPHAVPSQCVLKTVGCYYMAAATQANLPDYRNTRIRDDHSLADMLCANNPKERCTQVNLFPLWEGAPPSSPRQTLSDLVTNDEILFTLTGIFSINLLKALMSGIDKFTLVSPTNRKTLSLKDKIVLTMIKIKQNMAFAALGALFGINQQTCTLYFKNTCTTLAQAIKVVIPWAEVEMLRSNFAGNKKDTELMLACPNNSQDSQDCKCLKCVVSKWYTQYENIQTEKLYVKISPSGLLTEKMLRLVHRFLTQKNYLDEEEPTNSEEAALLGRNVEAVVQGLRRRYRFFGEPISRPFNPYIKDILTIVAGVTNVGPPIIEINEM